MREKLRIGVVFGGRSGEHEVSLVSASSVINALDEAKYEVIPVGITQEGRWISSRDALELLKEGNVPPGLQAILPPDYTERGLLAQADADVSGALSATNGLRREPLDVVIPVLHGTYGEDGTIQGLLELAGLPYVGADVLGSALNMDKVVQKQLCRQAGLPMVAFVHFMSAEWRRDEDDDHPPVAGPDELRGMRRARIVDRIEQVIGFPVFVKPANLGSSVGIVKAHDAAELFDAIDEASQYDRKVIVEQGVANAREIEVSVLGNESPRASVPGEVIPSNEFYDYDAKYVDDASDLIIPAELPEELSKEIQRVAVVSFRTTACEGMARVDFLLERETDRLYLNELNTIPGFTEISMYPKLWEASGLSYSELLDELIRLALDRHGQKKGLRTSYQPKSDWFR